MKFKLKSSAASATKLALVTVDDSPLHQKEASGCVLLMVYIQLIRESFIRYKRVYFPFFVKRVDIVKVELILNNYWMRLSMIS